jgi:predicted membrane-bound mannosyltransferase
MSAKLLAEFLEPDALKAAVTHVRTAGFVALQAFTPYPIDGLAEQLGQDRSNIRPAMLTAGLGTAAFAFALQWYSAVIDYPIISGGRPLNSWQVFLLVPFEVGVFAAALAGVLAFLWSCRLPRLHDALFEIPGFERATEDRYFLLTACDGDLRRLRTALRDAGAVSVTELRQP